jgi:uncharacterized membrane protein YkvA (DUF1232 family)
MFAVGAPHQAAATGGAASDFGAISWTEGTSPLSALLDVEGHGKLLPLLTQSAPLENQLSAGTTQLLRTIRKRVRQLVRSLSYGAGRWSTWLGGGVLFLVVGLVVPVLGRDNLRTFRQEGFLAFTRELSLAVAVYVRLLIDGRTPMVGKALLAFSVVYGASAIDLLPDRAPQNYLDDLILIMLASRSFMQLCPEEIVEEHALAAARARAENLQKKLGRRRRPAKDVGGAASTAGGVRD